MVNWHKLFAFIESIAVIVGIVIASWSLWVTIDSTYGNAKIRLEYTVGGNFNVPIDIFFYQNKTVLVQFLVKNVGHGSTAYTIEPQLNCLNCKFTISYDGEEFKDIGTRPIDVHPIPPKSTQFIMVIFKNITQKEAGEHFEVLVRDLQTNDHNWIDFRKNDQKATDLMFRMRYG